MPGPDFADRDRRPLLSIGEVAERLGVSVRHVRRLVQERRIPFFKWGHLLRFDCEEIDAWLEQSHVPALRPVDDLRRRRTG